MVADRRLRSPHSAPKRLQIAPLEAVRRHRVIGRSLGCSQDLQPPALAVSRSLLRRGYLALPADGDSISITPPVTVTDAQLRGFAAALGEERGTIEDVIEPYLIQQGYLMRTPRGRVATRNAWTHFGLTAPASEPGADAGRGPEPDLFAPLDE